MSLKFNDNYDLWPIIQQNILDLKLSGPRDSERRSAYISGVYFSLILALYYEEAGRPLVNKELRPFLENYHVPQPTITELIAKISYLSHEKINLDDKHIPNYRYIYGRYGQFYVRGIRDSLELCLNVIPELIMVRVKTNNRAPVLDWLNTQMHILNPLSDGLALKFVNE